MYITTSRLSDKENYNKFRLVDVNKDLYRISKNLGIVDIHFTNNALKYVYLKYLNPIVHLDDDSVELDYINKLTKIKGLSVKDKNWKSKLNKIITDGKH